MTLPPKLRELRYLRLALRASLVMLMSMLVIHNICSKLKTSMT